MLSVMSTHLAEQPLQRQPGSHATGSLPLEGKIEIDEETARRLFTLICVLHIRA